MIIKKPWLYNFRMQMFGQKYTRKESFILKVSTIFVGIGSMIAGFYIITIIMGLDIDADMSFYQINQLVLYMWVYIFIAYAVFYYITKFIVEAVLYLYRRIRKAFKQVSG